jgi:hypothetical protein
MWRGLGAVLRWLGMRLLVAIAAWAVIYTSLDYYLTDKRDCALQSLRAYRIPVYPEYLGAQHVDPKDDAGPLWRAASELAGTIDILTPFGTILDNDEVQLKDGALVVWTTNVEPFMGQYTGRSLTDDEYAGMRKCLAESQSVFDLLHQATLRPQYESQTYYSKYIGTLHLSDFGMRLTMSKLLRLAAEVALYDGRVDRAIEYWTLLWDLRRWSIDEPLLDFQAYAAETEKELFESVQRGLKSGLLGDEELRQVQAILEPSLDYRDRLRVGVRAELTGFNGFFRDLLTGRTIDSESPILTMLAGRGITGLTRLWMLEDQAAGLRSYCRLYECLDADLLPFQFSRELHEQAPPPYALFSRNIIRDATSLVWHVAAAEAARRVTAWGVALRRQRLATGSYPDSLADVRPEFAKAAGDATDPFTGQPLVYRRQGAGFIVYSIGRNMTDDGGRKSEDLVGRADDIVFELDK